MYEADEVKGCSQLSFKWREAFRYFCVIFWQAQGAAEREQRRPVRVAISYDKGKQVLRADCADGEWHHVTLTGTWY